MRAGDRIIVALTNEYQLGDAFTNWPLHVTIVAWFRTDVSSGELADLLKDELRGISPFTAVAGKEDRFGYRGKVLVNLIELPSPFVDMQKRVVRVLDKIGADVVASLGQEGTYKPHVTARGANRLHEGDVFGCDRLYIVSKQSAHDRRKLVDAVVPLGTPHS